MNRFLQMLMFRAMEEAGSEVTGAAVVSAAPVETAVEAPIAPETPVETPVTDPNDQFAQLDAAFAAELPTDEAITAEAQPVPDQYAPAMEISEFVKSPENLQQAVRAADEVWKVASGQAPASQLLEGMREANPQGFQPVVDNLTQYIEQITGKSFGAATTEPVDPREARISALESKYAQEEQTRQQAAQREQMQVAEKKGFEFVGSKLKGTAFEGQDKFLMPMIAAKLGNQSQAMQEILAGNTKTLEKAINGVKKDIIPFIQAINAATVKKFRTLANGTPAVKGSAISKGSPESAKPLAGETVAQQVGRLQKEGLL